MAEKKMERSKSECLQCQPPVVTRSEDPWLVYTHEGGGCQTFYSLSEGCRYDKAIPELSSCYIYTCSHGWLVIDQTEDAYQAEDEDDNDDDEDGEGDDDDDEADGGGGGGGVCFLWNPVSMNKIMLPQLRQDFDVSHCCVLTSAPDTENCFVVFASSSELSMMFCQPGDKEWTVQELPRVEDSYYGGDYIILEIVTCGGKIYAFSGRMGDVMLCIDVETDHVETNKGGPTSAPSRRLTSRQLRVIEVYEFPKPGLEICFTSYLESCGEVYRVMVWIRNEDLDNSPNFIEVDAFKLDLAGMVWERMDSLGVDRAFLIGRQTMGGLSCPATRESRIEANCIYYHNRLIDEKKLYQFNVQDQSFAVSLPCPDLGSYLSLGPYWIVPHI